METAPQSKSDSQPRDFSEDVSARVRRSDYNRFICSLFAPTGRRDDLHALYAFNAEIAEIRETVSEPMVGQLRLKWWHDALAGVFDGDPPHHPVATALAQAVSGGRVERRELEGLIEARSEDLVPTQPVDLKALEQYAAATSGRLSIAALGILNADEQAGVREAVSRISTAWAITGLLTSLPVHAAQGYLYLPADICARHGLDSAVALKIRYGKPSPPAAADVVAEIATAASRHLDEARQGLERFPRAAAPVFLQAVLARHLLARLSSCEHDPAGPGMVRRGVAPSVLLRLGWHAFRRRI